MGGTRAAREDSLGSLHTEESRESLRSEEELVTDLPERPAADARYVPAERGTFPPRPVHPMALALLKRPANFSDDCEEPFSWVPGAGDEGRYLCPMPSQYPVAGQLSLPLEKFDNPDLELNSPQQWLDKSRGVPARSRFYTNDGHFTWAKCFVTGYSADTGLFSIRWVSNGKEKHVKRLNLMFGGESDKQFRHRLNTARQLKELLENELRYFNFVDKCPFTNDVILNDGFHLRIAQLADWELAQKYAATVEEYRRDVEDDYVTAVKRAVVEHQWNSPEIRKRMEMEDVTPPLMPRIVPQKGCSQRAWGPGIIVTGNKRREYPPEEHEIIEHVISSVLCAANPDILDGLQLYFNEMDIRAMYLVDNTLGAVELPVSVHGFREHQAHHLNDMGHYLHNDWLLKTVAMIENLPKNLHVVHDIHVQRMERIMKLMSLLMTDQIRTVVLQTVRAFSKLWATYKPDPMDGRVTAKMPLFQIHLELMESSMEFLPSLQVMEETVMDVFDSILQSVEEIEDISSKLTKVPMSSVSYLNTVSPEEDEVKSARDFIAGVLQENMQPLLELQKSYQEFSELAALDAEAYVPNWVEGKHSLAEAEAELAKYKDLHDRIQTKSDNVLMFTMTCVHVSGVKQALISKAVKLRNALLNHLAVEWRQSNDGICDKYQKLSSEMKSDPTNAEELDELHKFFEKSKDELADLKNCIADSSEVFEALHRAEFPMDDQDSQRYWTTAYWPMRLNDIKAEGEHRLQVRRAKFKDDLKKDVKKLMEEIDLIASEVNSFISLGDIDLVEERVAHVHDIEKKLKKAQEMSELYKSRESIFEMRETDYPTLASVTKTFKPYEVLWNNTAEFMRALPEWMDGPFTELDTNLVSSEIDKWARSTSKVMKQISGEAPAQVAQRMKEKVAQFEAHLPLIVALRNPGLRDRHWDRMSEEVGFKVKADEGFSVSRALQMELPKFMSQIEEVSEHASKEYSLERTLEKMQTEWTGVEFGYLDWRTTGTYILQGVDEIQMILDDQIVKTQSMRASPYIGPFEDRVRIWEKKLNTVQEIMDEWLKCQQQWLYLEPIFGSEDIMQQMPNEGRKFKAVDTTWRQIMEKMVKNPEVLTVCSDEELLKNLQEANKLLDVVQKGLNDYLETKRLAFPRFYFLSNDELLEILSETKDPLRVQPFLRKIFEGIDQIRFEEDLEVTAMISEEKEAVDFVNTFNPKDAGGNVEKWLIDCENAMRDSLKDVIKRSFEDYQASPREEWVVKWPGQAVICVDSMYWTSEVEAAIKNGELKQYSEECTDNLMKIVGKVRGKLSKLERKTLSALIVIDVHARDVIVDLHKEDVTSETNFSWMSQLRYMWDEETGDVIVKMINAAIFYGYEYLGNGSRLVITPLTDRCYRTLMGALHLNLGGAPEGPAGTGKTETVKDLAKAMAMQCVVFNCSDGLDYLAMGKFFKGLASSGAWACFDEFNRIDLEVLSVIAQQILTIQMAKSANLTVFEFEGTKLGLRATCSVFITMNPGYAGRSELPDNLKVLFRTVAMMVPDYALISEILLYSSGYLKARDLARKLVATYKLCSEQLSSQSHYDYGMRAVISVLRAAGAMKQKYPDQEEDVLMLRSLTDVNAPKFLAPDIPLFEGILSDLFPGVVLPDVDYKILTNRLVENCERANVQPTARFLAKALELYEMIIVRHGLMIVGYSYGAKTCIYRALAGALTDCAENGELGENKVTVRAMNPKSIYMGQLYGEFDAVSHEWHDGVLAKVFRECATDTSPDRKWVLFDGPVDAIWIENMNTVLDDNKKLCLMSGEIIQMSRSMNMIFEVQDLAVASPATVSRCGMIYVEPTQIGWEPLRKSWMNALPEHMAPHKSLFKSLFDWLVEPCFRFVRKNCKEIVPTSDINLPQSLMNLLSSLLSDILTDPALAQKDGVGVTIQCLFAFSCIWGIGGCVDSDGRLKFDPFFKKLLNHQVESSATRSDFDLGPGLEISYPQTKFPQVIPDKCVVYDVSFDRKSKSWVKWMDTVQTKKPDASLEFHEIIVETQDTVRYSFLLEQLVSSQKHVIFAGPTGTGKTVYIKDKLNKLDGNVFQNIQTTFSAQTNANQVQDMIDMKLDKRRKGVYGPPFGLKCVIFVDDLNMPAPEVYGAQPPIELLRQWMDYGGWFERSDNTMKQIVDVQFVASMGPPGGGRNHVTPRYLRHFNILGICEFTEETYTHIYGDILGWWMNRAKLSESVRSKASAIVKATINVYNEIRKELLPTPAKSHYTFNMRDLSKVFQGMAMFGGSLESHQALARVWVHEALRVFHDRLVNDEDRKWFFGYAKEMIDTTLGLKFDDVFKDYSGGGTADLQVMRQLLFGDFMVPGAENPKYVEIKEQEKLIKTVEEYLGDYNAQNKNQMHLVLFLYAAEHICRISRVLKQPFGNGLLLGVGGSGRQSLTRISAFMAEYFIFSIEISKTYGVAEWREDLKTILRKSGGEGEQCVFLFSDTQLKLESFLEDLNNILNTGEIPNLFPKDEMMQIMEMIRPRAKRAGRDRTPRELYDFFVDQCRQNLHTIICMSPLGSAFRTRLRKFPSLVNCCTIDWFSEWPEDALKSVAHQFLSDVEMDDQDTREAVEDMCMLMHQTVRELAADFYSELKRHYYATPTSYLELISTYKALLGGKRKAVHTLKNRYEVGLEKLLGAEKSVGDMKEELIALQPVLIQTSKEVEETLVVVNKETEEATAKAEVVQAEEAVANEKAAAAKKIKDDCEAELSVALPLLQSALKALDTLTKSDITEVKAMKNPPLPVKVVMEAVCLMLSIKPKRINDPNDPVRKIDDYWGPAQALLGDTQFLANLQKYDKDNIDPAIVKKIQPFISMPEFQPDTVKKASKAAYGLCCWVRAMEAYDRVAKVVAPKKAALAESEAEYTVLMEGLNAKKAELKKVQDKLDELNAKLNELLAKKDQLEKDVESCKVKLDRAEKLIGGLGGEKTRWTAVAKKLNADYTNLTGDVLLSGGYIAYLGAFTAKYRESIAKKWVQTCAERKIPCADKFSLQDVLGQPVLIRDWVIDGLPNDGFSIENAIVMSKARRWPLMIDPQNQANKWVKNMEKKNNIEVIKLTDSGFVRTLENCIQFGNPCILENVGEELDPTIEPLLLKSIFKQGGSLCIKLGDSTIEYSEDFRFYITTKLRNPHYLPEVSVKVTLLNFMITPDGLQDQLLGIVVMRERPELEEEKTKLVLQGAENARQLKEIEDKIIEVLSSSEGNILDDEGAINVISSAKTLSNEIDAKQKVAAVTEQKIDEARMGYTPVAQITSMLFFCISDLCIIEPTYQYSLPWFIALFEASIKNAEQSEDLQARIDSLVDHFQYSLYKNICRSLLEKDRLLFSFSLCVTIFSKVRSDINVAEYLYLLTGGLSTVEIPPNPSRWISDKNWGELVRLDEFEDFKGILDHFRDHNDVWNDLFNEMEPQDVPLPEPWNEKLSAFQSLLVMRCVRPDKLVGAVQKYVMSAMGQRYVEPPPFDLEACFADSTCTTPLIFVLSPGSDPMAALMKFAENLKINFSAISLGQGQGPKAEKLIVEGQQSGDWVVLQNCHLAVSWMPTLEQLCEQILPENTNPNFRLWLTSYPSEHFPVAVLQNGVKMTNEAPKGLRANLTQSYLTDPVSDPAFFDGCQKPAEFKKLLFGLCFFHANVQERVKFGPIGWNVAYAFSLSDFAISVRQLFMFLNEFPDAIPLDAIKYLTGECNYGGRVTDAHDRVTLMSILDVFFTMDILKDGYSFSPSGTYYAPQDGEYESYIEYIKGLPLSAAPEAFGLHSNADITKDQQETDLLLSSLLSCQASSSSSGGAVSRDELLLDMAVKIQEQVRKPFDLEYATYKYPVEYLESMNTVLCQEMTRYNRLIEVVHSSLSSLQKALKGQIVMTGDLEALGNAMFEGRMPALWAGKSYPSMKPIGRYVEDLIKRLDMLTSWLDNGPPEKFWVSGFYFTHAFLTGVAQNFARKYKIPIDNVSFDFECLAKGGDYSSKPEDGAYVYGMFVEGARWCYEEEVLKESEAKVLYSEAPMIWLQPCEPENKKVFPHYLCPVYRTPERKGTLATTGHSTNFVIDLRIPSDKPADHWIRRGVAFLLSLAE